MNDNSNARYSIGEKVEIEVVRQETNFDKACDAAYQIMLSKFGVDDCGNINNVKDAHRSEVYTEIIFKGYKQTGSMVGGRVYYIFEAVCLKNEYE